MENKIEIERIKVVKLDLKELQETVQELTERIFKKEIKSFEVRNVRDRIKIIIG